MSEEQKNQVTKSDAVDYVKTLGRDGAYVELNMESFGTDLMKFLDDYGDWPKQMVLKAGRFDITDPEIMDLAKKAFRIISTSEETKDMNYKQIGFFFFKKVFETGLKSLAEGQKPLVKYGG